MSKAVSGPVSAFALFTSMVTLGAGCSGGDDPSGAPCTPRSLGTHAWPPLPTPTPTPTPIPGLPGATSGTATLTAIPSFGDNPGGLAMYAYAPASAKPGAPVVVALHGCTQSATAYANAGWNAIADQIGVVVVYAEQATTNDFQRCFRWWEPAHTTRDRGEAKSIRSMVDAARAKYGSGDAYVTGLSAGGAMTAVMLATYPDVFRAGAIMSGLPYHCAQTKNDAYGCMSGKDLAPAAWRALLPSEVLGQPPRVSIWHGDTDYVVRTTNATQLVRQWTAANQLTDEPTATETVGPATHDVYRDARGVARVERWTIRGMSHGVALDPKGGCGTAAAYMLDEGLCSAQKAAEFFGLMGGRSASGNRSPGASGEAGGSRDCTE